MKNICKAFHENSFLSFTIQKLEFPETENVEAGNPKPIRMVKPI